MTDQDREMIRALHDALLKLPAGSPDDAQPLLEEIRVVVLAYKRASWAARALIWLLPAFAGLGVAYQTITGWFK